MTSVGFISKSGLGKVFLWGDDRTDVKMEITQGPTEVKWKKYSKTYTTPSVFMRNIQYGVNRYILLVNNSKEVINLDLSGFPGDLRYVDLMTGTGSGFGTIITPTIEPLGVRMYKIAEKPNCPHSVSNSPSVKPVRSDRLIRRAPDAASDTHSDRFGIGSLH